MIQRRKLARLKAIIARGEEPTEEDKVDKTKLELFTD